MKRIKNTDKQEDPKEKRKGMYQMIRKRAPSGYTRKTPLDIKEYFQPGKRIPACGFISGSINDVLPVYSYEDTRITMSLSY